MKIAIIGYGKMGHMIEEVALSRGHSVVCRIEPTPTLPEGKEIYSPEEGFESEAFRSADVAIEFTTPLTAKENILRAWAQGVPVVCGSTGWKAEELIVESLELKEVGSKKLIVDSKTEKTMLVWSSNFSVGVNIFFDVNTYLAEQMAKQPQYTPSITEIHHIHKLDKPSGTAKTLAEGLRVMGYGLQDSEIESIREGEVPGTHEVKWDSEEDTIIITHIAKGRRGFALGAVLAAEALN
jgi:4-hydroxy-tetrahydrodipicolinate reductase